MNKIPKKGAIVKDIDSGNKYYVTRMPCADKMFWTTFEPFYEIAELEGSATIAISIEDLAVDFEIIGEIK